MEKDADQGPDAAPIKPVSSLRAKFENLQNRSAADVQSALKLVDPVKQPALVRASLDLPRPGTGTGTGTGIGTGIDTGWPASQSESHHAPPRTPGATGRTSDSPTRSNHKKTMSMQIQSSPQLTPAVQIDSPKSPPRSFFLRSQSRSPERVDHGPFGKVRELVSQHSSRSSTRASTPGIERSEPILPTTTDHFAASKPLTFPPRPRSPIPPPINRAEKPKIPAKPQNITAPQEFGLSATPLVILSEKSVSPFNTPPSSDGEEPSSELPPARPAARSSVDLTVGNDIPPPSNGVLDGPALKGADPRSMGFTATKPIAERKDPRTLGFSPAQQSQQLNLETRNTPSPARVVPSLQPAPVRDARDLGFSSTTRQPPSLSQQERPSPARVETTMRQTPARDARQYGFSSTPSLPSTPIDPPRPDLPQRVAPKIPPPRPSEDTKRPVYAPSITRPGPRIPYQNTTNTQVRRSEDIPRTALANPLEAKFLPPPKRVGTFNYGDLRHDDSLAAPDPTISRRRSFDVNLNRNDDGSDEAEDLLPDSSISRHDYPDGSHINRRPPAIDPNRWRMHTKTDGKAFDICGNLLCTASYHTRIFDLESGEDLLDLNHGETVKTTAIIFKPGADIKSEGRRVWIGNNLGDLQEIDLETRVTIAQSSVHNKTEITRIFRHHRDLWTLDESSKLFVWQADKTGVPNLKSRHISHKLLRPPTYAFVVEDTLWVASGKEIRVYRPGYESDFNVLREPISSVSRAGDVTCGAYAEETGRVYIGHTDGHISTYSRKDYSCLGTIKVSDYKINAMTMVGDKLWAGYKTGMVYVYDTSSMPWKVKKVWKAHDGPVTGILMDPSSVWLLGRMQVATTGHDQYVALWDGMLEEDWVETTMQERAAEYCTFRDVHAAVTTWNCGAANPSLLKTDFIREAIHAGDKEPPEILVFGFQEVVDLEDRTVTAKSILGFGKKKENNTTDQHQSKVYREWRNYLARCIRKYIPHHNYVELQTSSLIGLLSCVFVHTDEHPNITKDARQQVKCGMGGRYGNKGALLSRFILDSSSLCFINCHLAAGQTGTSHRNNDVATILESESLPAEPELELRTSLYVGGGDGRQILDHEICILNGDLNYRIDTIPRNVVIKDIQNNDLEKLLKQDQLNISRRRVAGFRLAPFTEMPITFAPTYKYDVGTDRYDTSDKKRAPAWCDRLLFRSPPVAGSPRVQQLEYCRHEHVYDSDHRPVSGVFQLKIKKVDAQKRKAVLKSAYADFERMRKQVLQEGCVRYLVSSFGITREEAKGLIQGVK